MKILVACEFTGTVRDAFTQAGHDAMSCDLLDTLSPGEHYKGDALDLVGEPFDMVIAHPPCTYLSLSGVGHLHYEDGRWEAMEAAAAFFRRMFEFNSPRIAVENPVQHGYAVKAHGHGKPTQYVEPWHFGAPYTKKTGLWLKNLPPLVPSVTVKPATTSYAFDLPSEISKVQRAQYRSKTFPELAQAMVKQWGRL